MREFFGIHIFPTPMATDPHRTVPPLEWAQQYSAVNHTIILATAPISWCISTSTIAFIHSIKLTALVLAGILFHRCKALLLQIKRKFGQIRGKQAYNSQWVFVVGKYSTSL